MISDQNCELNGQNKIGMIHKQNFKNWTLDETLIWLEECVKLPQYRSNFQEIALDGLMMDFLTDEDLERDLKIKVRLHRVKIIEEIKKLKLQTLSSSFSPSSQSNNILDAASGLQNNNQIINRSSSQVGQQQQHIMEQKIALKKQQQANLIDEQQQIEIDLQVNNIIIPEPLQFNNQNNFQYENMPYSQIQDLSLFNQIKPAQSSDNNMKFDQQPQINLNQINQNKKLNNNNSSLVQQMFQNQRNNSSNHEMNKQYDQFEDFQQNLNVNEDDMNIERINQIKNTMFEDVLNVNQVKMIHQCQQMNNNLNVNMSSNQIDHNNQLQIHFSNQQIPFQQINENIQSQIKTGPTQNNRVETPPQSQNRANHVNFSRPLNDIVTAQGQIRGTSSQPVKMIFESNLNQMQNQKFNDIQNDQIKIINTSVMQRSQEGQSQGAPIEDQIQNQNMLKDNDVLVLKAVEGQLLNNIYIIGKSGAALGRHSASNDIVISESFVSRRHCEIKYINEQLQNNQRNHDVIQDTTNQTNQSSCQSKFYLRDIGSTTGAFVMVRQEILLQENMMFQMGLSEFRIVKTSKKSIIELHVFEGPQRSRMITVDHVGGLTIGRDMQNSFYVQEDSQMSNFHAKIEYYDPQDHQSHNKQEGFYLQDIGSTNRTWLRLSAEGEISSLHPLKVNDIIKIGSTVFVVQNSEITNSLLQNQKNKQPQFFVQFNNNQSRANQNVIQDNIQMINNFSQQEEEKAQKDITVNNQIQNENMIQQNRDMQLGLNVNQNQSNYLGAGFSNPISNIQNIFLQQAVNFQQVFRKDNPNHQKNDEFAILPNVQDNRHQFETDSIFQQENKILDKRYIQDQKSNGIDQINIQQNRWISGNQAQLIQNNHNSQYNSQFGYNNQFNDQQIQGVSQNQNQIINQHNLASQQFNLQNNNNYQLQNIQGASVTSFQNHSAQIFQNHSNRRDQQIQDSVQNGGNSQGSQIRQGTNGVQQNANQLSGRIEIRRQGNNQIQSNNQIPRMTNQISQNDHSQGNVLNVQQTNHQSSVDYQQTGSTPTIQTFSDPCKICYGAESDAAFIPCGHNFACVPCSQRCECCPVCRIPFDDIIKLYKQ